MVPAIYVRVSRPDEIAILDNQLGEALRYCEDKGFFVPQPDDDRLVYREIVSGGKDNRSRLSDLLHNAERRRGRPFDLVVFTALSRMTRGGTGSALYILNRLEKAGVGWRFVEQPVLDYDSTSPPLAKDIILGVLSSIDKDYRARISLKTRAALAQRKRDGKKLGRHPKTCECPKHGGKRYPQSPEEPGTE
jgi:DNA invertase Pin-like site-specific DNA recombinase